MPRALISVSDKTGLEALAKRLVAAGVEIISTGGTADYLERCGVPVTSVADITGFPEIMDGRVKTLHPKIHGGILGRREVDEHRRDAARLGIDWIDWVVVNLYPFRETVSQSDVTPAEAIEQIDIGGPTLIRAAAKNYRDVIILTNPKQYEAVVNQWEAGELTEEERLKLAVAAFRHTAHYDAVIASYFAEQARLDEEFPAELTLAFTREVELRYGENPHQRAAMYREALPSGRTGLVGAEQLQGKQLSFNNLNDAQACWDIVQEFDEPAAVAVKHANPCGAAIGATLLEAYERAYEADPVSIFGGIVAVNRVLDAAVAEKMASIFLEVILAPDFTEDALRILSQKKNLRLLKMKRSGAPASAAKPWQLRRLDDGLLVQTPDDVADAVDEWKTAGKHAPTEEDRRQLAFAWKVVKHVKSNAIVVARDGRTLGIGAGQMNRIDAARIALQQAEKSAGGAQGAYLASDAFFPFGDVVQTAAEYGIRAIVQPGGSIRDEESIRAADEAGIPMLFTGRRHFLH